MRLWRFQLDQILAALIGAQTSCRFADGQANGLDPDAYLAEVIGRTDKGHPINRLVELLPWNWNRQTDKLTE